MVKKGLCVLLAAVLLTVCLSGCGEGLLLMALVAAGDNRADKQEIMEFVRESEQVLLAAVESKDFSDFENQGFINDVRVDQKVVDFDCGGAGIGSGTSYVGFYYTPENDMAALWCAPSSAKSLKPEGDGFGWQERNGDNRYYTEHICGNFYYYEASY